MIKQNITIVDVPILYNILEEIKENLSFNVSNFNSLKDFSKFLSHEIFDSKNYIIITKIDNKNLFLERKELNIKNIFFLCPDSKKFYDDKYNIFTYPINIHILIEKINIQLIKLKYNFQSKLKVKNYSLDLNSRIISNEKKKLRLTEREMDIILFLNENSEPQNISDLQSKVWRHSSELETHTVETHIYRLRKKIFENFNDNKFIVSTDKGYLIK
tara:strand:+ start:487 stop:1131 length:645 start_codon:yes stop_codon:yes gene_type:complete